jgi:TatD DNase family protein
MTESQSTSVLFDTHCHLNHQDFDVDRSDVWDRAIQNNVKRLLVIGYDLASSRLAASLANGFGVWASIGIHPDSVHEWTERTKPVFISLLHEFTLTIRAFGEIGLDYRLDHQTHEAQQKALLEQIAFALGLSRRLPLIIHNRDALSDLLSVFRETATPAPIVMHCFTGTVSEAKLCLDAGCYLGIGGISTFKKCTEIREAVAYAPIDRLLLETDCPYLAPQSHRGRRNEPSYLPEIAAVMAAARNQSVEEVIEATTQNAMGLFGKPIDWLFVP